MENKKISLKHKNFIVNYLSNGGNIKEAYQDVYFCNDESARTRGSILFKENHIQKELKRLEKEYNKEQYDIRESIKNNILNLMDKCILNIDFDMENIQYNQNIFKIWKQGVKQLTFLYNINTMENKDIENDIFDKQYNFLFNHNHKNNK